MWLGWEITACCLDEGAGGNKVIKILGELIRNLVLLLLLATFLEMLLPKSTLSRHIRLVVGLFVMLTILQPIIHLFNWQGPIRLSIREPPYEETRAIVQEGLRLRNEQHNTALQFAERHLEQQLEAMIYLNLGVDKVYADLTLESRPDHEFVISQAKIIVSPLYEKNSGQGTQVKEVEPVVIGREQPEVKKSLEMEQLKERIQNGVSAYLGLDPAKIQVVFDENSDS